MIMCIDYVKLGDIAVIKTGQLDSNRAVKNGAYPFFTCSPETLKIDDYAFDQEAVLLAGNNADGNYTAKYYSGKFNAYQRTYVINSKNSGAFLTKYLCYALNLALINLKNISQGTSTKFLTKTILNNLLIPNWPLSIQLSIVRIIDSVELMISNKAKTNDNLLAIANQLYDHYFPYTDSDKLPNGWTEGKIGDIIVIHDSKRNPLSAKERSERAKVYPYYGAASITDYVDDYIFDGIYLLLGEDGTVVNETGGPMLQYVFGKFWVNNHAHILTGKKGYSVESLFLLCQRLNVDAIVTGAVQPKISQANLKDISIVIPPE